MRLPLARWTILPLLAVPVSTWALGLGEIELQSGFRQPLRARIELLSPTPEVLETLRVSLAPVATFERFAVDRPAFLTSFEFSVGRDDAGRSVVLVTSTEPISELFVTMFVEARWSGGISLREYTMLLDLPVRLGQTEAPAPAQAARTRPPQPSVVGREIERPATTSAPQPSTPAISGDMQIATTAQAETPVPPHPSGDALTHGPVQRAETLWDIAAQYRPAGVTMNQVMVAIYEANPQAFSNNMNVLRIGAVLRIPDLVALRGVAGNAAAVEVHRQTAEWQDPPQQARLTVPAPSEDAQEGVQVTQAQSTADDTQLSALQDQIGLLQSDLEEIRRLLAIRDQELSDLRAQVAAGREREAATSPEPETVMPPPAAAVADIDLESIPLFPDELLAEEPLAETDAIAAPPVTADPGIDLESNPAQDLATVPEERSAVSQVSRLISVVSVAVGVGALLLAALLFWRRRRADDVADITGRWEALERETDAGDTCRISAQIAKAPDDDFVVHEQQVKKTVRGKHGALLLVEEDADSLAEADFQMAYGSYDRAAAQLSKALEEAPDNRELKLRLMEVFFQWGNKQAFLEAAQDFRADLGEQTDGDWDKVVIMGKQICPDERLFAEATPSAAEVDLHLQAKDSSALDLVFGEQDWTDVDVDIGGIGDAGVDPEAMDGAAVAARSEATDGTAVMVRSEATDDREKAADLPATSAEIDVSPDGILDVGELLGAEESSTVTQERPEVGATAAFDAEPNPSSATDVSETPDPVVTEGLDDTAAETELLAEHVVERRADDREQEPPHVDDLATKLDLAKAYLSIGQPEQAIRMLEEALREAADEPEQARRMLEEALQEAAAAFEERKRSA